MRAQLIVASLVCLSCTQSRPVRPHDLDGDGRDELLVRQFWDGRIRTLEPDGTLGDTVLQLDPGDEVFRIGDMNGDGRAELVVHDGIVAHSRVRVFLGRADGTVEPVPYYDLVNSLRSVAPAGDVNGDGLADLAVDPYYTSSFVVFGSPVGPIQSEFTMDGYLWPAMDLDGDGRSDLITGESETEGVHVYRVRLGGSDTEHVITLDRALSPGFPDPSNPSRDLLIDVTYTSDSYWYTGVSAWNGNGFSPVAIELPPGRPGPHGQILGDLQLDSLFLSRTETECVTYIGQPGSILATIDGICDSGGSFAISVAGDLDEDGFDEIVYPERSEDGPYSHHLRVRGGGREALTEGLTVRPTFEEVSAPFTRAQMEPVGDLNGDGIADLFGVGRPNCVYLAFGGPRLLVQTFCEVSDDLWSGSFPFVVGPLDDHPGDELIWGDSILSFHEGRLEGRPAPDHLRDFRAIRVGDVDADGLEDWADDQRLLGGTHDLLAALGPTLLENAGLVVGLGDVNGDGIDDLGVGPGVRFGSADVAVRAADLDLSTLGTYVFLAAIGDRDGDGWADIGAWWYLDDGSAGATVLGLTDGVLVVRERFSSTDGIGYAGDLDGDGRSEILTTRGIHFASGEFLEGAGYAEPVDLDGDGRDERFTNGRAHTSVQRWTGTDLVDVPIERPIPFSEFALLPVH